MSWKFKICDNCAKRCPIADPQAFTNKTSFRCKFSVSVHVTQAVRGLIYICAAVKSSIESGIGTTKSADVFTYSCQVPSPRNGNTRLPIRSLETKAPTSSTIPTPS